jgi:hypothetical protein
MSKEAMKLALEALEEINKLSIGENAICLPAEIDAAMDALREALADERYEKLLWDERDGIDPSTDYPETYDQGGTA